MLLVDNRHLGPPRSLIRTYFFSSLCIRVIFIYTHIYIFIYLYNPKICVLMVCVYTCLLYVYFWMFKVLDPLPILPFLTIYPYLHRLLLTLFAFSRLLLDHLSQSFSNFSNKWVLCSLFYCEIAIQILD